MNWSRLVLVEATAFNYVMYSHGIEAFIDIRTQESFNNNTKVFPEAVMIYLITVKPGVKFNKVTSLENEIRSEIAKQRMIHGFDIEDFDIRFSMNPILCLETESPKGYFLSSIDFQDEKYQAFIGASYSFYGRKRFIFNLLEQHQTLIAAFSGHGKSVLLSKIANGLLKSTHKNELSFHIIDFKNDDLRPFMNSKNTMHYASSIGEVEEILDFLSLEKELRKNINWTKRRLLLLDEAAELPKQFDEQLASIMKMGRSIGVNTILATQHPTANQIGQQIARSFTHRFIGRVESSFIANWATGIKNSGAESLKKPGSFLYCFGGDIQRIQVFI